MLQSLCLKEQESRFMEETNYAYLEKGLLLKISRSTLTRKETSTTIDGPVYRVYPKYTYMYIRLLLSFFSFLFFTCMYIYTYVVFCVNICVLSAKARCTEERFISFFVSTSAIRFDNHGKNNVREYAFFFFYWSKVSFDVSRQKHEDDFSNTTIQSCRLRKKRSLLVDFVCSLRF